MDSNQTISAQHEQRREELLSALKGRADFYSLIASLFFRPLTQDQIDGVAEADLASYSGLNEEFDRGINDITRALRKRNTGTREQLATDYTGAFVGTKTYEMKNAVPFESVFTSEDGLLCRESFHEVRAMFRKASFKVREDDALPDDHLGYLCEFISVLTRRAAEGLREGCKEDAVRDLESADRCRDEHILNWYGSFYERAQKIVETRFYRGVLEMAGGYFEFDRGISGDLIAEAREY